MSAPYRIERRDTGEREVSRGSNEELKAYLERLMKIIPGEIVGLYLIGSGFVPEQHVVGQTSWFAFCFLGLLAVRLYGTADPANNLPPAPVPVALSSLAFVVWAYTIGGPFRALEWDVPWVGSILVLATSFVIPFFYQGESE